MSFQSVAGGQNFVCGLMSGGSTLLCWDIRTAMLNTAPQPRRVFFNRSVELTDLSVGEDHVCAREVQSGVVRCWRGGESLFPNPELGLRFSSITSGKDFSCGILRNSSQVSCWGSNGVADLIETQFGSQSMLSLVAGVSHACGIASTGLLICRGNNESGQLNVPFTSAFEFSGLALGENFTCGIHQKNGMVSCWGSNRFFESENTFSRSLSFESIVAGLDFVCGLTTRDLSVICWGPGWSNGFNNVSIGLIIPGPCVQTSCNECGVYLNSEFLCDGSGSICRSCSHELPLPVPLPRPEPPDMQPGSEPDPASNPGVNRLSLVFLIVGSIGGFAGICAILYCLIVSRFCGLFHHRVYNSDQPEGIGDPNADISGNNGSNLPTLRSFSTRRHSSRAFGRQRSGSSSVHIDKAENFSLSELSSATSNFSLENKIGSGSFGTVYKGKLADGRKVATKRAKTRRFQENNDGAFESELALLSRVHHKHLVGLIGFCQEMDERLLVYEYMSNGSLYDHLHNKSSEIGTNILTSWKTRIKIALDAARGIEYLHSYAVPPIIHRDIKSSNILLNSHWTARVSDFGLSLLSPESDFESMSTKAVGTIGYIDPEYYVLNVLTPKSDVYGFGVVLLEILTGKKAIFKNEDDGTGPLSVVDFAVPLLAAGQLFKVLDKRARLPEMNEAEALELLATFAVHCVSLEGKERPNMSDIVTNLEKALALCEDNGVSFSTVTYSTPSD